VLAPVTPWGWAEDAILVAHLLVPFGLGALSIRSRRARKTRDPLLPEKPATTASSKSNLAVTCSKCGAPVPLELSVAPCPSCDAPVEPPSGYAQTLIRRKRATRELHRAERMWRRSAWSTSPIVILALRVVVPCWALLGLVAIVREHGTILPELLVYTVAPTAFIGAIFNWTLVSELAKAGAILPPPVTQLMSLPSAGGACSRCGAPVGFAPGTLAALCGYCGGDEYRAALARTASADASEVKGSAKASLLQAYRLLSDRRADVLFAFALIAAFELLLIGGALLEKIPYVGALLHALGD
jgi:hypothetical protein